MRAAALFLPLALAWPVLPALAETTLSVAPVEVAETKALYGRVESRFVVPARSRIGGTLTALDVTEGSMAEAGQIVARIVDSKLESQLAAAEARLAAAQSQLANAESELARNETLLERGATTVQRVDAVRTQVEVARNAAAEAEAARAVTLQQIAEGAVIAPATGRVLALPVRLGEVLMPGTPVVTIAGGGVFLRLAIPERHAAGLQTGAQVQVEGQAGTIEKVYPQIENGRVIADVAVNGLSDAFVGQRVLVQVPVATRAALALPEAAILRQGGLDLVRLAGPEGSGGLLVTVVPGGIVEGPDGPLREILTGIQSGDTVVLP